MPVSVQDLSFGTRFQRALPVDPDVRPWSREVRGAGWSRATPSPVAAPRLIGWAEEVGALLGVARPESTGPSVDVLAGNRVPTGAEPFAACYGGHQFGQWAGQLGDGRAIALGDVTGPGGTFEVQLKGAGPTPYSRRADGRAVLRSSVREFICSEAMFHLGVPTTRALALVTTGEPVVRDMFYDGNAEQEPGAIVTRVSPSFVRFGNFELPASRGEKELLQALADHVIGVHYPEIGRADADGVVRFFAELSDRTARLMARWMALGFVHGVMNTDNLSVLGLTIDYGPYGWLDPFDPDFTPNTTDYREGRYRWRQQAAIGHWNLARLAHALVSLVGDAERLNAVVNTYPERFAAAWRTELSAKLGYTVASGDDPLVTELFSVLQAAETDWTLFFRGLADVPRTGDPIEAFAEAFYAPPDAALRQRWGAWVASWRMRTAAEDDAERRARMNAANPCFIPRNWVVQECIEATAAGDIGAVDRLLEVLRRPYTPQPEAARLAGRRPDWARNKPGCSALSCSS
jgi:uncharacterized protein YdiU (UPF0061 family)